jgi:hypothetical protein
MRALAIAREAWRNILSGTTRTLTFALVLGAVTVTLLCADQFAIRQIVDDANHFRASGASTLTLAAERKIDGAACESLNSLDGVTAAGAMRNVEPGIRASALPSSPIALTEVTAGFPRILTNEPVPGAGAILSSEAADTLGLSRGDTLETTHGATTVAGTFEYPDDGRRRGLGYAALVVTSSDDVFDECWVDAWPTMPNLAAVLLTTLTPSGPTDETKPVLGQLNAPRHRLRRWQATERSNLAIRGSGNLRGECGHRSSRDPAETHGTRVEPAQRGSSERSCGHGRHRNDELGRAGPLCVHRGCRRVRRNR